MTVDQVEELVGRLAVAPVQRGLSQRRHGTQLGLSEFVVRRWEAGVDLPFTGNFVRWARALGYGVALLDPARQVVGGHAPSGEASAEQDELRALVAALRTVREDAGVTQQALADELSVSRWSVSIWETAVRLPRFEHLIAWAERLGCRITLEPTQPGGAPWTG